jgi:hypothetical protein
LDNYFPYIFITNHKAEATFRLFLFWGFETRVPFSSIVPAFRCYVAGKKTASDDIRFNPAASQHWVL